MSLTLHQLRLDELELAWPHIEGFFQKALDVQGLFNLDTVLREVEAGNWSIWLVIEDGKIIAAGASEIIKFPRKTVCFIHLAGGMAAEKWQHFIEPIGAHAKKHGAEYIRVEGRKGWAKRFKDMKMISVTMEKRL